MNIYSKLGPLLDIEGIKLNKIDMDFALADIK